MEDLCFFSTTIYLLFIFELDREDKRIEYILQVNLSARPEGQ